MWVLYKVYYSENDPNKIIKKEVINSFSSKEEIEIVVRLLNKNNTKSNIGYIYQYFNPFQ